MGVRVYDGYFVGIIVGDCVAVGMGDGVGVCVGASVMVSSVLWRLEMLGALVASALLTSPLIFCKGLVGGANIADMNMHANAMPPKRSAYLPRDNTKNR